MEDGLRFCTQGHAIYRGADELDEENYIWFDSFMVCPMMGPYVSMHDPNNVMVRCFVKDIEVLMFESSNMTYKSFPFYHLFDISELIELEFKVKIER